MARTIRTCRRRARRSAAIRAALPVLLATVLLAPAFPASAAPVSGAGESAPAAELRPLTSWGAYLSALHASRQKDSNRASEYFTSVTPRAAGRAFLLVKALQSHILAGRMERATGLAGQIVSLVPRQPMSRLVLALHAARNGRYAEAQKHIDRMPHNNFNRLLLPLIHAWLALGRHGDPDLALDEHRDLVGEQQFQLFRLMHEAYLLDVAGQTERAAQAFRAISRVPSFLSLRMTETLSNFLARSDGKAAALESVDRHLATIPDSMTMRSLRAAYLGDGPVTPVIGSPADGLAEVLLNVASAFDEGDRAEQALPLARLAVWMRPRDAASVFLLGSVLEHDSRYRDAVAVFRRLQSGSVYSWEARKSAAATMVELDRHAAASAALEKMADERPGRFDALWLLGNVHRSRSAFGDAVKAYDRAIGRIPKIARRHWNLLYARGIALERSGQWPRAEADFLHALRLNPDQPYVLNYLAYSWVDRGEKLARARGMLKQAVKKRPNDGYIVDSVGWVEYRLGNFGAAVRHLERAAELRPHDPIINQHLGDAYWRAGRRNEARFQWNRALWLGPEDADRKKIETRLRNGMPPFKPVMRH